MSEKNPHAESLGRLGGLKGGPARAKKLTKEQRSEIAQKAAKARWSKKPHNKPDHTSVEGACHGILDRVIETHKEISRVESEIGRLLENQEQLEQNLEDYSVALNSFIDQIRKGDWTTTKPARTLK